MVDCTQFVVEACSSTQWALARRPLFTIAAFGLRDAFERARGHADLVIVERDIATLRCSLRFFASMARVRAVLMPARNSSQFRNLTKA
jgi:hypothetical protein